MTQDLLHELFEYKDGDLVRRVSRRGFGAKKGSIAGTTRNDGYIAIKVNGTLYFAHRLIWVMQNGDIPIGLQIDHINGVRDDNRIENLRLVTKQENCFNMTKAKGYTWNKRDKKFQAQIYLNGKNKVIGFYDNEQDAHQAYLTAKEKYHRIGLH